MRVPPSSTCTFSTRTIAPREETPSLYGTGFHWIMQTLRSLIGLRTSSPSTHLWRKRVFHRLMNVCTSTASPSIVYAKQVLTGTSVLVYYTSKLSSSLVVASFVRWGDLQVTREKEKCIMYESGGVHDRCFANEYRGGRNNSNWMSFDLKTQWKKEKLLRLA